MKNIFSLVIFFFIINITSINSMTVQEKVETLTSMLKNKMTEHFEKQKQVNNKDYLTTVLNNLLKIETYCDENNASNENTPLEEYLANIPLLIQTIIDYSRGNYYMLRHGKSTTEMNEAWTTLQTTYNSKVQHHNTLTTILPKELKLEILNGKAQSH